MWGGPGGEWIRLLNLDIALDSNGATYRLLGHFLDVLLLVSASYGWIKYILGLLWLELLRFEFGGVDFIEVLKTLHHIPEGSLRDTMNGIPHLKVPLAPRW